MGLNSVVVNQNQSFVGVVLHWPSSLHWLEEQFFDFCQANKELRIERTAQGDCEILAPTGGETGRRNYISGQNKTAAAPRLIPRRVINYPMAQSARRTCRG